MDDTDWLIMLGGDGTVTAVEGGAPPSWIRRRIEDCAGMPEAVRAAARAFVRGLSRPLSSSVVRRARLAPEAPGSPSFTLLAIEAIPLRSVEVSLDALNRSRRPRHQRHSLAPDTHMKCLEQAPPGRALEPPRCRSTPSPLASVSRGTERIFTVSPLFA